MLINIKPFKHGALFRIHMMRGSKLSYKSFESYKEAKRYLVKFQIKKYEEHLEWLYKQLDRT